MLEKRACQSQPLTMAEERRGLHTGHGSGGAMGLPEMAQILGDRAQQM